MTAKQDKDRAYYLKNAERIKDVARKYRDVCRDSINLKKRMARAAKKELENG